MMQSDDFDIMNEEELRSYAKQAKMFMTDLLEGNIARAKKIVLFKRIIIALSLMLLFTSLMPLFTFILQCR